MSRRDSGPPENDAARTDPTNCPGPSVKGLTTTHNRHQYGSAASCRYVGRYPDVWREGFCYGFLDALRCAARRTDDPEVWAMLTRLGYEYTLDGGDG